MTISGWRSVQSYWRRILKLSLRSTIALVVEKRARFIGIAAIVSLLTFVVLKAAWGVATATDYARPVLVGVIVLVGIGVVAFLVFMVITPVSIHDGERRRADEAERRSKEQRSEIAAKEDALRRATERIEYLVQRLGPVQLSAEQQARLVENCRRAGRRSVSIDYLDSRTARADAFAWQLTELFRSVPWHVKIRGVTRDQQQYPGVSMKIEDISSIRPNQQSVLDAFREIELACTLLPGNDVGDRVELLVGEM